MGKFLKSLASGQAPEKVVYFESPSGNAIVAVQMISSSGFMEGPTDDKIMEFFPGAVRKESIYGKDPIPDCIFTASEANVIDDLVTYYAYGPRQVYAWLQVDWPDQYARAVKALEEWRALKYNGMIQVKLSDGTVHWLDHSVEIRVGEAWLGRHIYERVV